jgi:two-component system invasion response regulator UvrY
MKKFLLVDDHAVIRSGLNRMLTELYEACEVIESSNTEDAIELMKTNRFDLLILDVQMPNSDSFGLLEYINARYPETKALIFSMASENLYAKRFLKLGAKGFLSKDSPVDEIINALNTVLNNKRYISKAFAEVLAINDSADESPFDRLTQREFEITAILSKGTSILEASKSLNLQGSTLSTHKSRIFEKLGITNMLELKELAKQYNL